MANYKDYWFISHDGLPLYARDYTCLSPDTTVICIPGLTRNSADFSALCEHLEGRVRVIAIDLRGRGESAYDSDPENYQLSVYVQDIIQLIDSLQLHSVILVGTSLGGLCSLALAGLKVEQIKGLVINDIGPEIELAGLQRIKDYVVNDTPIDSWDNAVDRTRQLHSHAFPTFNDEDWLSFTRNIYRSNDEGKPELNYDPAIASAMTTRDKEPEIVDPWDAYKLIPKIPMLLIRGALSDILSTSCVEKMRTIHPHMDFVEVDHRGHAPLLNESECLSAIDRLIDRVIDT